MDNRLSIFINDVDGLDQGVFAERWQGRVHVYLNKVYGITIASEFQAVANTDNIFNNIENQKGYLEALLDKNNTPSLYRDIDHLIKIIIKSIPKSLIPLQRRRKNSKAIDFNNEYDYQDFIHSILTPWIRDIRPEEYSPSHAGTSKRVDFLLKDHQTFIEVKYVRDKSHAKKLGDEITIDIHHYQSHPKCKYLVVAIYDPNRYMQNPKGFEADLSKKYTYEENELNVKIYVN